MLWKTINRVTDSANVVNFCPATLPVISAGVFEFFFLSFLILVCTGFVLSGEQLWIWNACPIFGCHWYDDICPERKGRITRHSWIIIIFSNYELKFKLVVFFFNLQGYLTMLPLNSSNIKFSLLVFSMVSWFYWLTAGTKRRLSI